MLLSVPSQLGSFHSLVTVTHGPELSVARVILDWLSSLGGDGTVRYAIHCAEQTALAGQRRGREVRTPRVKRRGQKVLEMVPAHRDTTFHVTLSQATPFQSRVGLSVCKTQRLTESTQVFSFSSKNK